MIEKIKNFLSTQWPILVAILGGIAVTLLLVFIWNSWQKEDKVPEINTVPSVSAQNIQKYFPESTESEVKQVAQRIQTVKETQAPQYHYYTYTQAAADQKAQEYATKQKADKVIKTTETKEIAEQPKKENSSSPVNPEETKKQEIIENNYYAINMEKKHRIDVGAAVIDRNAYATVSYRNRDVTYTAFYSPSNHTGGGMVTVTVAKW